MRSSPKSILLMTSRRKGSNVSEAETSSQKHGVQKISQYVPLPKTRPLQNTDHRSMDSGCESRWKKMIGKPYSGKLNVRFDEGELEIELFCHYANSLLYPLPEPIRGGDESYERENRVQCVMLLSEDTGTSV